VTFSHRRIVETLTESIASQSFRAVLTPTSSIRKRSTSSKATRPEGTWSGYRARLLPCRGPMWTWQQCSAATKPRI